ncbi:unnamed protein product [Brugia timori]|uniref:Uncharacterized protein n=1 Tax=Brugia timori TaxID=42155 RepID=A0A0R3QSG8_9BILA|nr:unnamed protein product [Brugia timori]
MDIKELSDIHTANSTNAQSSISDAATMARTMTVDSSEFDDEDYDKMKQNGDDNSFPKLENPDKFSEMQAVDEQRHEMNEERDPERRVDTPIFSPEQIPTFEEWLSSLPIQPAFPFSASNGIRNQPPAEPIHFSFPRPFRGRSKEKEKEQHLTTDSKKQQNDRIYDYDDSENEDKGQFHEQRFTLPRNVPYE